ncbi:undecaprenyl-phosphate glucose phosphotransferase [Citrobacter freundii]|uniref:undecaprenyl-phosphate glucose phosphotransferase n=1 Tax=Citrobacter freundii TaxID=546 RepID=UPI002FF55397
MLKNSLKISSQGYPVFLKLVDFIVINVVLIFSAHLLGLVPFNTIAILSLLFSIFFLLFAEYIKMYQQKIKTIGLRNQKRLVFCTLLAIFFNELVSMTVAEPESLGYLDRLPSPFYSAIIYWYFIPLPFLYYIRFFLFKYTARKNIRVAVIGLTENGLAAENALTTEYANIKLDLAFYDERSPSRCGDVVEKIKSPFRGSVSNLVEEARQGNIDEIYIALPMVALHRIRHFLAMMSDTTVDTYIVPDFYTYSNNMSKLRSIHNLQTIGIFSSPFEGAGSFIKRAEDLILGSIIMVMISSLMLAIAIGIKLTSRGPVFFKQDRYGLSGQKIKVWKFRSMRVMENSDTVIQATKNDPRVTKFGSFLRRTSLDELPQFINVLQGSMSIVGPRPHAVTHNEQYRKQVENYMIRHKVKPGITGLAQINGFRGEIDALYKMEKRVQYDIEYIQNWSLWLDIKIIIKTIFKGFVGKNAY